MTGALLVGVLTNGLQLLGVDPVYHDLIKGIIIIFAVAVDMYADYKNSGLKKGGLFKHHKKAAAN